VNVCNELSIDVLLPVVPPADNTASTDANEHECTPAFNDFAGEMYATCTLQPLQHIDINDLLAGLVSHDVNQQVAGEPSRHVTHVPLNLSPDTTYTLTGSQISQLIQLLGQQKQQVTTTVTAGVTAAADHHVATVLQPGSSNDMRFTNDLRSESGRAESDNPTDSACAKQSRYKLSSRKPRMPVTRRTRVVSQASEQLQLATFNNTEEQQPIAVTSQGSDSAVVPRGPENQSVRPVAQPDEPSSPSGVRKVTVMGTSNSADDRVYDKRYYCLYCDRPLSKIKPHLESQHHNEISVAEMMSKKDRQSALNCFIKLRNLGNHKHNSDVLRAGTGVLIVKYRPSGSQVSAESYAPCPHCYGYYYLDQMWKHVKQRCPLKPVDNDAQSVVSRARNLLPVPDGIRGSTRSILSRMHPDDVYRAAINDDLIMQLAHKLTLKHFADQDKHDHVRAKIREVGRLLVCLKQDKQINSIREALDPARFKDVVDCVRKVAGYVEASNTYDKPSLAVKLGHSLHKCAAYLKSMALQECNGDLLTRADAFEHLYSIEWSSEVSTAALRSLNDRKLNKVTVLPLARDIKRLSEFLSQMVTSSMQKLNSGDSSSECISSLVTLTEATLAQIVMFNRRRAGEVSKMKISMYKDATDRSHTSVSDFQQHLSPVEQHLCHVLTRIEIPGKRGRTVPVLLTARFREAVDCILSHRSSCDVPDDNVYVFARPASLGHIRCCDVLRRVSMMCGAENPETLRSTQLRKHIATVSQVANLKDNELDLLAQFLGHDINVHREFYRLPLDVLQTAKVAKLLIAMENGQQQNLTGKTLDDIDVKLNEGRCKKCSSYYCV
jgi:hypothetical protein